MDQVLDSAAEVFAETGYEKATTNAIAARAGMSPGSLYQFFRNKEAIAEALAARYSEQMPARHAAAFAAADADLPLADLIDRLVDPMIAFNVANPAAHVLLNSADLSPDLAERARQLHQAVIQRTQALVAARAPDLPPRQQAMVAVVIFQVFKGLLPLVLAATGQERTAQARELKTVLYRYLEPLESPTRNVAR